MKEKKKKGLVQGARILKQTGRLRSTFRDMAREARLPGKRESESGKTYWESRVNRSDAPGKRI